MDRSTIAYTVDPAGIGRLVLNRPDVKNAISATLRDDVGRAIDGAAADDRVHAVVVTGAGDYFCAGADLKEGQLRLVEEPEARIARIQSAAAWVRKLANFPKPLIGRINGNAYGGGVGIVAACDVAIAVDTAKFAFPEVRVGLAPSLIAPVVIEKIGISQARATMLAGKPFDAARAQSMGLVHQVICAAALDREVEETLESLLKCSPKAVATTKRLIDEVGRLRGEEAWARAAAMASKMWTTSEARAGIHAFNSRSTSR